jgi:O-antigen/teichoic acid export membrane protein
MSIAKRLVFSVVANTTRAIISFTTGMIVARDLGPDQYGVFSFLLASLIAITSLFDMGSSSAFFSFISKRIRSQKFFMHYAYWLLLQFLLFVIIILVITPDKWLHIIWEGESRQLILIAFIAVFFQQKIWSAISQIGESQRLTTKVQILGVLIAFVHFILISLLLWQNRLSIDLIYYLIIFEFIVAAIVARLTFPLEFSDEKTTFNQTLREYWVFGKPLIPYAWLGLIMSFADTWLLQHFGGAVEQAYYAVASQVAGISLIFTSSVIRVLWKEVAEANENNNKERIAYIYKRINRILFMLGASITGFLLPWTEEIILLLLGDEYIEGVLVMSLMMLYPIHQSLGQINGSMYYALELTRPYVLIGMVKMSISIIAIYFMLAPVDSAIPGLGLGSVGLGLKMVILQFIGVNFLVWWLSRKQGWSFDFSYQLIGIGLFLLLGFVSYQVVNMLISDVVHVLIRGSVSGLLYFPLTIVIFYRVPWLIGMSGNEIKAHLNTCINIIFKKSN